MKTSLRVAFLFLLPPCVAAQDASTGAVGFAGDVVQTTAIVKSAGFVPSAAVSRIDADIARRSWHSRLLSYAMERKLSTSWQTMVVEYR